jgi:hypothetical protein
MVKVPHSKKTMMTRYGRHNQKKYFKTLRHCVIHPKDDERPLIVKSDILSEHQMKYLRNLRIMMNEVSDNTVNKTPIPLTVSLSNNVLSELSSPIMVPLPPNPSPSIIVPVPLPSSYKVSLSFKLTS